ncbi:hypothetical protein HWV62_43742 [Athelia sp. TMB]|nr:hypothetical protein HWV62_43742 [Athelia sp. TMB]
MVYPFRDIVDAARPVDPNRSREAYYTVLHVKELWWSIAGFIALVSVLQLMSYLHTKLAGQKRKPEAQIHDPEQTGSTRGHRLSFRRLPVAIINTYRILAFRCTLGIGSYRLNLAEVFLTVAYIVMLFTLAFLNTTSLEGETLDISYWGNRAGALAATQFPLITALGTKNNIIGYFTGMGYDKLNYLHRMTARVSFVLLWVHAASHIAPAPGISAYLGELFIRAGILAITAFSTLMLVSLRPIRTASYEIFFYAHLVTVLIMLVGAYMHTAMMKLSYYIWPAFLIWALDRVLRIVRLVAFNHSYFGFGSGSGTMDATTELLSDHFVRVRMRRPAHFHWSPGQTAYLIMPSVSTLPFEAHPFTIASIDSPLLSEGESEKELGASAPYWKELVFLIQARGGFTKRLRESALEGKPVKVFVDGPYGPSPDLGKYDTSVLVAGGTGVSYTLPVLLDIVQRAREGTTNCTKVVFIWAMRDLSEWSFSPPVHQQQTLIPPSEHLAWVSDTLLKAAQLAPSSLQVEIRIYVTSANGSASEMSRSGSRGEDSLNGGSDREKQDDLSKILAHPAVKVAEGRPDLGVLLREEAEATSGRMSVSVCGSQAIASAVRQGVRFGVAGATSIMRGNPSVTLHVESFGYA